MIKEVLSKHWKEIMFGTAVLANIIFAVSLYFAVANINDLRGELDAANNVIHAKVSEIQSFDQKLGLAEADLLLQKDLVRKYSDELKTMDEDVKEIIKKYNLSLKSRDNTIALLKQTIRGGTTTVVVNENPSISIPEKCGDIIIAYNWSDTLGRFKLQDPDILVADNEIFEQSQKFVIRGYVFTDKTGQLQIRKISLAEVVEKKMPDGSIQLEDLKNQSVSIADSKFEYINEITNDKKWTDVFGLRALATIDSALHPGIGVEVLNLGNNIDWLNVGIYGKVGFDLTNGFQNLQKSTLGAGIVYQVIPPLVDTNLGLGASLNVPFDDLDKPVFMIDAIFYLTN